MAENVLENQINLSIRTKRIKTLLQNELDKSRGINRPRSATSAEKVADLMMDDRWKNEDGIAKIQSWFDINVRTEENNTLQAWFDSETRDEKVWKKAAKTETTLKTLLSSCQNDTVRLSYKVVDLTLAAFAEWIKRYFVTQKNIAAKKKKKAASDAILNAQNAAKTVTCKKCFCTCDTTNSGRGLKNIKLCRLHNKHTPIAQLFIMSNQGTFFDCCQHCMARCTYCGCLALRRDEFVGTHDACTLLCRLGHTRSQVAFRVIKRATPILGVTSLIIGSDRFYISKCCVACDMVRNTNARLRYQSKKRKQTASNAEGAPTIPTTVRKTHIAISPLPPTHSIDSEFIDDLDLQVAKHYLAWSALADPSEKRERMRMIGIKERVLYARVKHLFDVVLPKEIKNIKKRKRNKNR